VRLAGTAGKYYIRNGSSFKGVPLLVRKKLYNYFVIVNAGE